METPVLDTRGVSQEVHRCGACSLISPQMRRMLSHLAAGALAATLATPALASPMTFSATLTVTVGFPAGGAFPIPLTATAVTATATGSGVGTSDGAGGAATLPGAVFSIGASGPVSPVYLNLIGGLALCGQGIPVTTSFFPNTGACGPSPNGTTGPLTFGGSTGTFPLLASLYVTALINAMTGAAMSEAALPLSTIGVGGTGTFDSFGGLVSGTLTGNPWTVGSVTQTGRLNGVTTVLTAAGFDARTASGEGTLRVVTVAGLDVGVAVTPALGALTIDFSIVPEPGTALLVGAGVIGLVMMGMRRRSV